MLPANTLIHNRYLVIREIATGGMGAVYEATDQRLDCRVALKQLLITNNIAVTKAFEREAKVLAKLRHPGLPRVTDYFTDGYGLFLVMDFIPGTDLAHMLGQRHEPFPVADVLRWANELLDAITYLHTQMPPIIHRDIKPHNLKLSESGRIMLLDFGIAKTEITGATMSEARSIAAYTLAYAPLEQIRGTGTDARSDLYALAATLYHLLTGQPPTNALTRAAAVFAQRPDPLDALHDRMPHIPVAVDAVVRQALALNQNDRPANAAAMIDALQRVRQQTNSDIAVADTEIAGNVTKGTSGSILIDLLKNRNAGILVVVILLITLSVSIAMRVGLPPFAPPVTPTPVAQQLIPIPTVVAATLAPAAVVPTQLRIAVFPSQRSVLPAEMLTAIAAIPTPTAVSPTQTPTPAPLSAEAIMKLSGFELSKGNKAPFKNGAVISISLDKSLAPKGMYGLVPLPSTPSDFVLHTTIKGGESDDNCLVHFRESLSGGYQVGVISDGYVYVETLPANSPFLKKPQKASIDWTTFDLLLIAKQGTYSVYLDGLPIISFTDTTYVGGDISLGAYSAEGANTAASCSFSDVWIWTP